MSDGADGEYGNHAPRCALGDRVASGQTQPQQALPVPIMAAITRRKTDRLFPTEVLIQPPDGGLTKPGKLLLYQVRTIAKHRIAKRVGAVSAATLAAIEEALRLALDLG